MTIKRPIALCWFLICTACAVAGVVHDARGQDSQEAPRDDAPPSVGASDVFAQVESVRHDIDQVRFELDKPRSGQPNLVVQDVLPREALFVAQTLLARTNRLCFKLTRDQVEVPAPPRGPVSAVHVQANVDAALEGVRRVKKLHIVTRDAPAASDQNKTHTDVFVAVAQANRELDLLLDEHHALSDVYEQVTLAMSYTARLRTRFPGRRMPPVPRLPDDKTPADVQRRLLSCFGLVRRIAGHSGVEMLRLDADAVDAGGVTTADLNDISALMVYEIAHLHAKDRGAGPPRRACYPGRVGPPQLYQRVSLLETQLRELEVLIAADPSWLSDLRKHEGSPAT